VMATFHGGNRRQRLERTTLIHGTNDASPDVAGWSATTPTFVDDHKLLWYHFRRFPPLRRMRFLGVSEWLEERCHSLRTPVMGTSAVLTLSS